MESPVSESGQTTRGHSKTDILLHNLSISIDSPRPSSISSIRDFRACISSTRNNCLPAKSILDDVTAEFPGEALTAIVGASGSGKTTLLNVLARRVTAHNARHSGVVTINTFQGMQRIGRGAADAAYVLQQDCLLPTLTVRETLQYAADLRLLSKTQAERHAMVETIIVELQLEACANTKIGDSTYKGCSGGEIRRTSIGVQLLADQPILLLDEPTTGLDATSALQVVQVLQYIARKGRTIIMTSKLFRGARYE
jgi:ABC-type multidrug transport system ATPase subunit